ncbi:bifunctional phosphopantothenoylcysteine decarboxylase/phosphopantothenate--cysteine ligase CoaBC [Methylococcus sp. EFPC2]|uniref:bifunctional phosphopantothenoylcysteine decarboxylase/phosphopantothenate--cysteine ligase CoaBC n=1 Tax=Methylococcus sp. EFPC2 TaxID=2812648 RepID=UPI00196842B7|nr:bifunctional phosphopantothenoylcysteine decarboxylase/phosphopantothenate--cysteine ligase CoaBC [Methylococcus sp. EFPC2]QSA96570.1 bifunctional phosphopantothenoylcysteine decarboxylase/phosphopantothenate--cysteine ligase CoaBC [Methylococcus sp. EFPC2]
MGASGLSMSALNGKHILLGVTGGIAAYKAAELTRQLKSRGAEMRVVMTEAAQAFVAPLTFQALSGNPVATHLLDPVEESAMGHIALARWAELVLIAPATADFIARLRAGLAGDLLSALCLASEAPLILAPAMNRAMWANPATQDNVRVLRERGIRLLGPEEGEQACGETGPGRMLEPVELCEALEGSFGDGSLAGLSVLITAGPTREPLDAVRYLSNRSSGKMGYALARAAADAGARVTLISGPVALMPPPGVEFVAVETAAEMHVAVLSRVHESDIYIGAAAVADYRPAEVAQAKIKKTAASLNLELTRTEDILAAVAGLSPRPFTVGFAAETDRLEDYARGKLAAKNLDMIAANWVGRPQGGFDRDENSLHVFWPDGERELPLADKSRIAIQLIELIAERFHAQDTTENPR